MISQAYATDYYIDCAGNNANSGLDDTHPWADFNTNGHGLNFFSPGDHVKFKKGCTFTGTASEVWMHSKGTPPNHIVIEPYGTGADPIFDASVDPNTDVPGWGSWVSYDAPNNVWVSNVTIPWDVNSVIYDGTASMKKAAGNNQNLATMSTNSGKGMFYQPGCTSPLVQCLANQLMYVRMADGSNPNTHTFKFSRYGNGDPSDGKHTRGQFGISDSTEQYIDIYNMNLVGSNQQGFASGAPYVNWFNCTSFASAREGWYIIKNAVQNTTGAAYNTINNSTATYSNPNFGQQITIESQHVDLVDTTSAYGWMAGIDWLDYNSSTNASYGRCIRCIAHDNGMRAINKDPNGFDPMGIYVDGGHDIQFIDSFLYGSLAGFYPTSTAANAIYLLSLQSEHPSTKPIYNIDVINCLIYNSNYSATQVGNLNCSGSACNVNHDIRFIGNTIDSGSGDKAISIDKMLPGATGVLLYNNIIRRQGGGVPLQNNYNASTVNITGDYNLWQGFNGFVTATESFSTVQGYGQELHSVMTTNPLYAGSGFVNGINQAFHLSNTASGQGSTSPGVDMGFPNILTTIDTPNYFYTDIGSTRTDGVDDNPNSLDVGYHYDAEFSYATSASVQVGTDYL